LAILSTPIDPRDPRLPRWSLWTYHDHVYLNSQLQPMKSTTNILGITFGMNSESHMKLFDISTDAKEDGYPLVESGRLNYGRQLDHPGLS